MSAEKHHSKDVCWLVKLVVFAHIIIVPSLMLSQMSVDQSVGWLVGWTGAVVCVDFVFITFALENVN